MKRFFNNISTGVYTTSICVLFVVFGAVYTKCSETKPEPTPPNPEIETLKSNQKRDSVAIDSLSKILIRQAANLELVMRTQRTIIAKQSEIERNSTRQFDSLKIEFTRKSELQNPDKEINDFLR